MSASRPEHTAPPDLFYNATEARKYHSSSRIVGIQAELAERAIELLNLPEGQRSFILDIGCGTCLSGEALEEAGHVWVGCDISRDMLQVGRERESDVGDVLQQDVGLGLPFRPGSFDGAISISALQWLCYADKSGQSAKVRLTRLFSSLYACLRRGGRAALQFYPETPEQAMLIASCAMSVGFTGGLVVDFPNSSKAKKHYLCLCSDHSYSVPSAMGAAGGGAAGASGGGRAKGKRGVKKRVVTKSKEWIQAKKDRQRRQGKETRHDSKYTGRKRSSKAF